MKRHIIPILSVIALLVSVFAFNASAYYVDETSGVLGYNTIRATMTSGDTNIDTNSDTLPYTIYNGEDYAYSTFYIDQRSGDVVTFEFAFTGNDSYSIDFYPMVYRELATSVLQVFNVNECSLSINYRVSTGGTLSDPVVVDLGYSASHDIRAFLDNVTPVNSVTYFEIYVTDLDESTSIDVSLIDAQTPLVNVPISDITLDDVNVNVSVIDNVPIGDFLWNSVTGFLAFEIIEGVQLYDILICVIALPLLVFFLKVIAGG